MAAEHGSSHATKEMRILESENAILKARLYSAGRENEEYKRQLDDMRKELKETRALLGRAVVAESLNRRLTKRHQSRSPSLEFIEAPVPFKTEEPLASPPIKLEVPSSQRYPVDEELNNRTKRRKLNPAPALSSSVVQTSNTTVIDLTSDESNDMVQGSSSSASEFEGGIENTEKRTYLDHSCKAEEIYVFVKDEVDELPNEVERPIPSQEETPLSIEVQISISDAQPSNQLAASPLALTLANEPRGDRTCHGENDRTSEPSAVLDIERETITNELESHPEPLQFSAPEGIPVSEYSEVDQIPNEDEDSASTHQVALSTSSYTSDEPTTPSTLIESFRQTTPPSAEVQESSVASTSGQFPDQASTSASTSMNSKANSAIMPTRNMIDQKAFNLSPSVVETYLQSVSPLPIFPLPLDIEVSRAFLHTAYGGSDRTWLQYIPSPQNPSDHSRIRQLVFPTLSLNPAMPSRPGMPGLIFASRHEILDHPPWTVFCKRSNAPPAVWLYLGEYENTLVGVMSPEQFRSQPSSVQNEWAMSLLTCKRFDVYVAMRARIALRKTGVIPVVGKTGEEKEKEEKYFVENEIFKIKRSEGIPLNRDDIITAFCKGEEAIDIIRMRCVQYDHVFANDMNQKLPQYSSRLAAEKERRLERASNTRKKTAMAKRQIDDQSSATPSASDTTPSDSDKR